MSSKDNNEELVMHSKSDNIENMIDDKADEVIEDFFNYFFLGIKLSIIYRITNVIK